MKLIKQYIKNNFSNFVYFYSILRSRLLIVILLSILVGFLDSIGLTMFLPLLQLADGSENSVDLGNLSFITDALSYLGIELTITKALFFLVIVFVIKGLLVYKTSIFKIVSQQKLTKQVRMSIVNKLTYFSFNKFISTDIGKIQNIFLGEISRLSTTYNNYISMIQGLIMIIMYMVFSFISDWKFALLVCLGGLISNLIFRKVNKLTKDKSKDISKVTNEFAGSLIQYIQNFKYLKSTGKVLKYKDFIEKSIDNVQYNTLQMGILNSKVSSFREPLLILIVASVILIQVTIFESRISGIMISLLFFYRALTSIVSVQNSYNTTIANQGAIDNIMGFISEMNDNKENVGSKKYNGFDYAISLKKINFSYDDISILNNIDIDIKKNSSIAFIGESGSGKTTLVNLIIKLLNPQSGEILIDNQNINLYNQFTYQDKIGYISQETIIFNDTIFNNVTFWADKTPENMERFNLALTKAAIKDFVDGLPLKKDAKLGNNGINLSGGQRQRISIARELYKNVDILILDEATSALDSQTENEIQKSIDNLKGQVTIISIAHRLSTIKNADVIYLLEKGSISNFGNFNELYNKSDRFKQMVELQEI